MRRARITVLGLLSTEFIILLVSGVLLYFKYRPTASQAWSLPGVHGPVVFAIRLRAVHRVAGSAALWTAIAAAVTLLVPWSAARARAVIASVGLAMAVVAASFTGLLLPWDQLALWAVTVGTNMRGYTPLFGNQVRFVLMDGAEISKQTVLTWLFVHGVLLGLAVAALVVVAWRRALREEGVT